MMPENHNKRRSYRISRIILLRQIVSFDVVQKFFLSLWNVIFHTEQSASINSKQKQSATTKRTTTTTIWLFNRIVWLKKNLFHAIAIAFYVCKSCVRVCSPSGYIDLDESNHMKIAVLLYILYNLMGYRLP